MESEIIELYEEFQKNLDLMSRNRISKEEMRELKSRNRAIKKKLMLQNVATAGTPVIASHPQKDLNSKAYVTAQKQIRQQVFLTEMQKALSIKKSKIFSAAIPAVVIAPPPTQNISKTKQNLPEAIDREINGGTRTKIKEGFVYIATNPIYEGWVKIGRTVDLDARLNSYQTGDPLRRFEMAHYQKVTNHIEAENNLKSVFSNLCKYHNEWFEVTSLDDAKRLFDNVIKNNIIPNEV